ncbi:UNVERIFIED_CONTAM: protein LYK5 [Sesamum calycinum]|uniref:Protein LYK5 n=1 Tax=Sesamum calycinum TaxID=2727403 RepID=A0AAW2P9F7_9LAMI
MNWILKILTALILFPPCINSQQKYSGNAVIDCNITDGRKPPESFLYTCNGQYSSCRAFLIFRAKFPYNTVPVIGALTSSGIAEIAKINNVTGFTVFPEGKEVIVPVNCSCSGQYYQASTTYQVPIEHQTYYIIANSTFQGLTTCSSLMHANDYSEFSLLPGNKLLIPLRCACPTRGQTAAGTKFLLTYSIGIGDTLYTLSKRFNSRGGNERVYSPQELILELVRFDRAVKVFKFSEIKKATGNFRTKNRIKGCLYRGSFRREVLAVKKSNGSADSEVKLLYQINHLNILKLHGFCEHKDNLYLVYEYMENGTLQEWLSRGGSEGEKSWNKRIQIALDVANGLLYLHSFTNPAYVHNDIRSSNILLNGNLRAKIANFSHAVKANFNCITRVVGSKGYMAPECLEAGPVTPKVDVFAFGVVLLELITDKYPVFLQDGRERLLSTTVAAIMQSQDAETELSHFIAPGLGENRGIEFAIQVVKLSLSCFRQDPADRPDMAEVVSTLLKVQFNIHKTLLSKQKN